MEELKARFITSHEYARLPEPKPGYEMWPEWFKRLDRRLPDEEPTDFLNSTVKECSPFADAMSAGYVLRLPGAVRVDLNINTGEINFNWRTGNGNVAVVDSHSATQVAGSGLNDPFKWMNYFALQLPEGWSALYTHPINRHDLPFRTLTGIVDDPYQSPVNFPFEWIALDAETFLDAGTPVAQIIPIQRVAWRAELDYVSERDLQHDAHFSTSHLQGYRRHYRHQKIYR